MDRSLQPGPLVGDPQSSRGRFSVADHRAEVERIGGEVGETRVVLEEFARAAQRSLPSAVTTPLAAAEAHIAAAVRIATPLTGLIPVTREEADRIQIQLQGARADVAAAVRAFDRAFPPIVAVLRSRVADADDRLDCADARLDAAAPVPEDQTWETAARTLEAAQRQLDLHGPSPHRRLAEATRQVEFQLHEVRRRLAHAGADPFRRARAELNSAKTALDAVPKRSARSPQSGSLIAATNAKLQAAEGYRQAIRTRIRSARGEPTTIAALRLREKTLRAVVGDDPPPAPGPVAAPRRALAAVGDELIAAQLRVNTQWEQPTAPGSTTAAALKAAQALIALGQRQLLLDRTALWKLSGAVPARPATVFPALRTAYGHALDAQRTLGTVSPPLTRAALDARVDRSAVALAFAEGEIRLLEPKVARLPALPHHSRAIAAGELATVRAQAQRDGWTPALRNEESAWLGVLARIRAKERLAAAKAFAARRPTAKMICLVNQKPLP